MKRTELQEKSASTSGRGPTRYRNIPKPLPSRATTPPSNTAQKSKSRSSRTSAKSRASSRASSRRPTGDTPGTTTTLEAVDVRLASLWEMRREEIEDCLATISKSCMKLMPLLDDLKTERESLNARMKRVDEGARSLVKLLPLFEKRVDEGDRPGYEMEWDTRSTIEDDTTGTLSDMVDSIVPELSLSTGGKRKRGSEDDRDSLPSPRKRGRLNSGSME